MISTERLVIQSAAPGDTERLLDLVDDTVAHRNGWTGLERHELERIFATADFPLRGRHVFVIIDRASGELLGERTFQCQESYDMVTSGSWLREDARGHGYGTEELTAFVRFVHRHLGRRWIFSQTDDDNVAARRQMEKAGFDLHENMAFDLTLSNGRIAAAVTYAHFDPRAKRTCRVPENAPEGWVL